jgi:RimJ/RimL family protein N-acetyltransferase
MPFGEQVLAILSTATKIEGNDTMDLVFKRFEREHYPEYKSWFSDPYLNRQLGPMDEDWLDAVLSELPSEGATWAVFRGNEMVAVLECVFDPSRKLPAGITALATKPALRQGGIGTAVLQTILVRHSGQGIAEHIAYISIGNKAGQRCFEKSGFLLFTSEPDENGYIEYRRRACLDG